MKKTAVFGARQDPIYKFLRTHSALEGGDMEWNFEKFLVDYRGKVIGHWKVKEEPNVIKPEIKRLLNEWKMKQIGLQKKAENMNIWPCSL